jgi:hypothetical protein
VVQGSLTVTGFFVATAVVDSDNACIDTISTDNAPRTYLLDKHVIKVFDPCLIDDARHHAVHRVTEPIVDSISKVARKITQCIAEAAQSIVRVCWVKRTVGREWIQQIERIRCGRSRA